MQLIYTPYIYKLTQNQDWKLLATVLWSYIQLYFYMYWLLVTKTFQTQSILEKEQKWWVARLIP